MNRIPTIVLSAALVNAVTFSSFAFSNSLKLTQKSPVSSLPPIERIVPYVDQDYDFELAIPENWVRIHAIDEDDDKLEPGYAVGFESPRAGEHDRFADYLMIEVLPGALTGAFESDGSNKEVMMVDGHVAVTDTVYLNDFPVDGAKIDLIVYQAEIVELGFTVAVYAIGEKHESDVLRDAFNLALKTLKVPDDPFSLS